MQLWANFVKYNLSIYQLEMDNDNSERKEGTGGHNKVITPMSINSSQCQAQVQGLQGVGQAEPGQLLPRFLGVATTVHVGL